MICLMSYNLFIPVGITTWFLLNIKYLSFSLKIKLQARVN